MRIFIAGEGAREAYLVELAREKGHAITREGPWDLIILGLPRSTLPEEWIPLLPPGQRIVCGLTDEGLDQLAHDRGWRLLRVLRDARYTQENAVLSAEGAVFAAMRMADFALSGASCAVIGYGRIGAALTRMLRGLGAMVTVVARRPESRDAGGPGSIPLEELPLLLPRVQVLFNTVPAPVVGPDLLKHVQKDALLIELASAPYGLPLAAAQEMGLRAWLESGIPGRYCPKDAARILWDYIEREMLHE